MIVVAVVIVVVMVVIVVVVVVVVVVVMIVVVVVLTVVVVVVDVVVIVVGDVVVVEASRGDLVVSGAFPPEQASVPGVVIPTIIRAINTLSIALIIPRKL